MPLRMTPPIYYSTRTAETSVREVMLNIGPRSRNDLGLAGNEKG
jgi:hypothetical protein